MSKISVLIADDHPILLKGLEHFLQDLDVNIVATCKDGKLALEQLIEFEPQLAILDLEMPHKTGLQVAKECKNLGLKTKIILLTLHKEVYLYQQAKELNLSGYLLKEFALTELAKAIEEVMAGNQFFSEKIFGLIQDEEFSSKEALTPSEIKILRLIAKGISTKEIADTLFVSERTVDKHRSNMIRKLNLEKKHNALLIWAQKNKDFIH